MVIAFEGIDGTGKTTISKLLFSELKSVFNGEVFWFSEPSPTDLGKSLKNILTSKKLELNIFEQSLLFTSDRSYLLRNYILPYNEVKKIILMDRSFVSTYAYQIMNIEDNTLKNIITSITEYSIKNFYIDILFYLDCDPEVSLSRIEVKDGIESKGLEYIRKVKNNYDAFIRQKHPHIRNIKIVDAKGKLEDIFSHVKSEVIKITGYIA
ncbi:MAG: dTMP kinase [Spirochaetia bacterium]|nr:dTMP kinase [Spirochaetota bacterium]MCX8096771.1 dTMP kinase [Spirochaetota bacterium]MDW8112545.1 dTMP kinase [Spirochaetia bacterium]